MKTGKKENKDQDFLEKIKHERAGAIKIPSWTEPLATTPAMLLDASHKEVTTSGAPQQIPFDFVTSKPRWVLKSVIKCPL